MHMKIVTTITTTFDPETMETGHSVHVDDVDGVHKINNKILWACVMAGARALAKKIEEDQPRLARAVDREAAAMHDEGDDGEDFVSGNED